MDRNWNELADTAIMWVKEAGELLRASLKEQLQIEVKANDGSLVTQMDRMIENFFCKKIKEHFPQDGYLGEEGNRKEIDPHSGTLWIIDPIDGTTNYIYQKYNFAISLAVYYEGVGQVGVVYNVMADELFYAVKGHGAFVNGTLLEKLGEVPISKGIVGLNARWLIQADKEETNTLVEMIKYVRGIRSYGSAAIEIAYVAAGRLDGYISMRLSPWDFAAGKILLAEVGGIITTFEGEAVDMIKASSIFVGNPTFHREVMEGFLKKEMRA